MKIKLEMFFLLAVAILFSFAIAEADHPLSKYKIKINPSSVDLVGEKTMHEIEQFFGDAELAIETQNMKALMGLYSERYKNGLFDKTMVKEAWKLLFNDFSSLETVHNMSFVASDSSNNRVIIRCTGLMMGTLSEKNKTGGDDYANCGGITGFSAKIEKIKVDNWFNNDHVLIKEDDGKWRIIGSTGSKKERLYFSTPLHPLF